MAIKFERMQSEDRERGAEMEQYLKDFSPFERTYADNLRLEQGPPRMKLVTRHHSKKAKISAENVERAIATGTANDVPVVYSHVNYEAMA